MKLDAGYIQDENEILRKSSEIANKIIDRQLNELTKKLHRNPETNNDTALYSNSNVESVTFIDTCALLEVPASQIFLENAALIQEKIIIPLTVMGELQSLASRNDNDGLHIKAQKIWSEILTRWKQGLISIYDSEVNGIMADELFQSLIIAFARNYDITIISQDYWLSQDLLTICRLPSVKGRRIKVKKLDNSGRLIDVEWRGSLYLTFIG